MFQRYYRVSATPRVHAMDSFSLSQSICSSHRVRSACNAIKYAHSPAALPPLGLCSLSSPCPPDIYCHCTLAGYEASSLGNNEHKLLGRSNPSNRSPAPAKV